MNPRSPHVQPHRAPDVLGLLWPGKRVATVLLRCCYGGATGGLPCGLCNSLILLSLRAYLEGGLALFHHDRSSSNMRKKAYHSMLRSDTIPSRLLNYLSRLVWNLDSFGNPKGIASFSPGLRGASYPGSKHRKNHQPCRGCLTASANPFSPLGPGTDECADDRRSNPFRVDTPPYRTPRVARASQPWAERSHPFRMTADLPRL